MNYQETIQYLFSIAPLFQQKGEAAYKEGLSNTHLLDQHFAHPHRQYPTIHIGGTNGKGSTAHTLAAILQAAGYKVGLYTSPHLLDFRERIRVNGKMISEQRVIDFIATERSFFEPLFPSFFEVTTALAFLYFAEQKVDVAVIEVGLGGRLDCTNIISPVLSIITNISLDHTQFLGTTTAAIAMEKAGIIKAGTPVVIGEATDETRPVFQAQAARVDAPIIFAEDAPKVLSSEAISNRGRRYETKDYGTLIGTLTGTYQEKNTNTILTALPHLPFSINEAAIRQGFAEVEQLTGLQGRWQIVSQSPLTVCDTGHNAGGWKYLTQQLQSLLSENTRLHIVFGMVNDKDITQVLSLLPRQAYFYFTAAAIERSKPAEEIATLAQKLGLNGKTYPTVRDAVLAAHHSAQENDVIYIGGSTFIVADFLSYFPIQ